MENKYYTPAIEEFHVGFEYEIWDKVLVDDKFWGFKVKKSMFVEKHLTQTFFNYNLILDLEEDKIRVKYLDKKDIESLGIEVKIIDCGEDTEDYPDLLINGASFGAYHADEITNIEIFSTFYTIKNKSELKRLLTQLRLIE